PALLPYTTLFRSADRLPPAVLPGVVAAGFDVQFHTQAVSVIPPGRSFHGGPQLRMAGEIEVAAFIQVMLTFIRKRNIPLQRAGALCAPGIGGPGPPDQVASAPPFGAGFKIGVRFVASSAAIISSSKVHFPEPGQCRAFLTGTGDQMGSIFPGLAF